MTLDFAFDFVILSNQECARPDTARQAGQP